MDKRKLALYFILNHTPSFADFFGPVGTGQYCKVRLYQMPSMISRGGALQGGRRWGKTFEIIWKLILGVFRWPNGQQLLTTLRAVHRDNIWSEMEKIIFNVPFFTEYLKTGKRQGSIKYTPVNEAKFRNGHTIYGIGVGDDPHASQIKGKSPNAKYVDESQVYPQHAADGLASTEAPSGCEETWAGVVDGRRDTPYYAILEKNTGFKNKVFKLSRRLDPHFNQENLRDVSEKIEGGPQGDRFGQEVDAEHGNPTAAVWNIDDVIACTADYNPGDTHPQKLDEIIITPRDYSRQIIDGQLRVHTDDIAAMFRHLHRSPARCVMGIDKGEAEPTMILPFVQETENSPWILRNVIQLRDHVDTVTQKDIIQYVVKQFPNCIGIGIDCTGNSSIADMLSSESTELGKIIVRVIFSANVITGYEFIRDEEQITRYRQEWGRKVKKGDNIEQKAKTKNFSTEQAKRKLASRSILFYHHPNLVDDFTAETSRRTAGGGTTIITPDNVHFPEALRCAAMAWWEKLDEGPKPHEEELYWMMPEAIATGFFGRDRDRMGGPMRDY